MCSYFSQIFYPDALPYHQHQEEWSASSHAHKLTPARGLVTVPESTVEQVTPRLQLGSAAEGGKVVWTIEGLHYKEVIWNAINPRQNAEVVHL